uniref:Uncharacterized protein n=1 Tax=Peronospora matthiolae TaxID=2874970 RepID=A0AAV1T448_9STRA
MSFQARDTRATSPGIGSDHDNDVFNATSPHGTGGSHSYQATPLAVRVSAGSHSDLSKYVNGLRETLDLIQHALDEAQSLLATLKGDHARLQTMKTCLTHVEAQLDLLIRMQHPVATPMYAYPASLSQQGTDTGTA